jgi:hypothetical protein
MELKILGAPFSATSTTFWFNVNSAETASSHIAVTSDATFNSGCTFDMYGGSSTNPGSGNKNQQVTVGGTTTLNANPTYDFTTTADGGVGWSIDTTTHLGCVHN